MATISATKRAKAGPVDHPVELTLDNGNLTYDPSFLRVRRGDTVTFSTPGPGAFEVMFKGQSPGNKLFCSNTDPTIKINGNAAIGVYQYAAAITNGNGEGHRVFLDSGCGDIGVEG